MYHLDNKDSTHFPCPGVKKNGNYVYLVKEHQHEGKNSNTLETQAWFAMPLLDGTRQ
jgi:hypothetical protein